MGSNEIVKIKFVYGIDMYILYNIIRSANRNNENFNLLTTDKSLKRRTCSLKVNETMRQ